MLAQRNESQPYSMGSHAKRGAESTKSFNKKNTEQELGALVQLKGLVENGVSVIARGCARTKERAPATQYGFTRVAWC